MHCICSMQLEWQRHCAQLVEEGTIALHACLALIVFRLFLFFLQMSYSSTPTVGDRLWSFLSSPLAKPAQWQITLTFSPNVFLCHNGSFVHAESSMGALLCKVVAYSPDTCRKR